MKSKNETRSRFERMNSERNAKKYRYCFLDYLYYRLYMSYRKHGDPPRFSACCVFIATFIITLLFFSIFFNCVLTDSWFSRKNFTELQGALIFFILTTMFCIIPFCLRYTRKRTDAILLKYKVNPWNRIIPSWMIYGFPLLEVLIGLGIGLMILKK